MNDFEIVRGDFARGRFHSILFDFDGTLSLIREGWMQIMVPMMVDILRQTGTSESDEELTQIVGDFVMSHNGKPTIYQMRHLAGEVGKRGRTPLDPTAYLAQFQKMLMAKVNQRTEALASGQDPKEAWAVAGCHAFLEQLRSAGFALYLASGTELHHVQSEAKLLGLAGFFEPHIYGPTHDNDGFTKRAIIDRILADNDLQGEQLLTFGDGFVELEEVKKVGGVAIAVATDEQGRSGKINPWKRDRLVQAGADAVIPDFQNRQSLWRFLFEDQASGGR